MPDYNKLTVIKLREELVKRGLPKTGLKPVLVNRLNEADAQAESLGAATTAGEPETSTLPHDQSLENARSADLKPLTDIKDSQTPFPHNDENQINAPVPRSHAQDQITERRDEGSLNQDVPLGLKPAIKETVDPPKMVGESEPSNEPAVPTAESEIAGVSDELMIEEALPDAPDATLDIEITTKVTETTGITLDSIQPKTLDVESNEKAYQTEAAHKDGELSALNDAIPISSTSLSPGQEMSEDSKKRKRRSQSPPPLAIETAQKRARMEDVRPDVKLPEDMDIQDMQPERTEQINDADPRPEDGPEINEDRQPVSLEPEDAVEDSSAPKSPTDAATEPVPPDENLEKSEDKHQSNTIETPTQPSIEEAPSKASPQDTRFKNLFTAPPKRSVSPTGQAPHSDHEDRNISPALHPATPALYIRDFMRPLHPSSLKEHLIALAAPSSSTPSPETITEFFLDPIRTHCLVGFSSTSAASRVRSSLHDRVWPNERTRRPLWVDFVPEEKLQKWIEVESEATGSRGHAAKRWEVVYEDEDGSIKAYLQEAGSGPRPTPSHPAKPDIGLGVSGAPSGPRGRAAPDHRPAPPPSTSSARPADIGKGFQALDDLFPSTTAKPKLYYLPVSKSIADRRLQRLDEGRGGGRGDELRRYTFEEDVLVDRGPDSPRRGHGGGYGGRGGGYGGGYAGGYQGRDNGYQGRDSGYQGRDSGYQGRDSGYQGRDGGYQGRDGGVYPRRGGGGGGGYRGDRRDRR